VPLSAAYVIVRFGRSAVVWVRCQVFEHAEGPAQPHQVLVALYAPGLHRVVPESPQLPVRTARTYAHAKERVGPCPHVLAQSSSWSR
jgi:hypothetical protein